MLIITAMYISRARGYSGLHKNDRDVRTTARQSVLPPPSPFAITITTAGGSGHAFDGACIRARHRCACVYVGRLGAGPFLFTRRRAGGDIRRHRNEIKSLNGVADIREGGCRSVGRGRRGTSRQPSSGGGAGSGSGSGWGLGSGSVGRVHAVSMGGTRGTIINPIKGIAREGNWIADRNG
ncbi:hypothetical protein PUN28_015690 [Cardiocondyla obscurior]|uniref:Uncharacterized protein n=1 Tax=Cardiocondyla obscurior TaxID=286306 RepID=A0AAW2EVF0_9HYME